MEVLSDWDRNTGVGSVGTSLAVFWGNQLLMEARDMDRPWDAYIFDLLAKEAPDNMKITAFEKAVDRLVEDFGTWNTPWGEINRFQRLSGDIDAGFDDSKPYIPVGLASGNWGALAAYGARATDDTKRLYGYRGNSFVAVVEFGEKVKAKTILAGGQSSDPNSAHFFDQAQRYADVNFKEVAYYREEVEKRGQVKYRPGKREVGN